MPIACPHCLHLYLRRVRGGEAFYLDGEGSHRDLDEYVCVACGLSFWVPAVEEEEGE